MADSIHSSALCNFYIGDCVAVNMVDGICLHLADEQTFVYLNVKFCRTVIVNLQAVSNKAFQAGCVLHVISIDACIRGMYCGSVGVSVVYAEEACIEVYISLQRKLAAGALQVINVNVLHLFIGHGDAAVIQGEFFQIAITNAIFTHSMPCSLVGKGEVNGTGRIILVYIRTALVEIAGDAGSVSVQVKVNDGGVGCTYVTNNYNIVSCTLVDVDNSVGMPSRIRILAVSIDRVECSIVSIVGAGYAATGHVKNGAIFDK